MTAVFFDTLGAKKTLTGVGVEEKVAEAIVAVAGDAVLEDVATKADIRSLKADIERDIARLKVSLMNGMIVVMGAGIAVLGFIIVVVEFIPGN